MKPIYSSLIFSVLNISRGGVNRLFVFALLSLFCASSLCAQWQHPTIPECFESQEPSFEFEETLCDQYPNFEPDITIGANASSIVYASEIAAPAWPGWVNEKIFIQGTLIADDDLFFINCTVKMGPGAIIKTQDAVTVGIFLSRFFSCSQMWRGFFFQEESMYSIWASEFEDAQYALTIDDGVMGHLSGTTFNRNYVGIRNYNAVGGQSGLTFGLFGSNNFTCDAPLNDPYSGQSPDPGELSFAGIYLNQCVSSIGIPNYGMNTFSSMRFGIYAQQSSVTVRACRFEDMQNVDPDGGRGILMIEGSLLIDAPYADEVNLTDPCVFDGNAVAGVEGVGANLNIRNATFEGSQPVGIYSYQNLSGENVVCWNNTFTMNFSACFIGIWLERSVASGDQAHTVVAYNDISMSALSPIIGMYGIYLVGPFTAIDHAEVFRNYINAVSVGLKLLPIYIAGDQADGFRTYNNEIDFANGPSSTSQRWGIAMFDSYGIDHEISENHIQGAGSNIPAQCAIHVDQAQNVVICDNFVDHTRRGMHLLGINAPCRVSNNDINAHYEGLLLENGSFYPGVIGPQVRHGNVWADSEDYVNWAAQCLANPNNSRFFTENDDPDILPALRSPGGDAWFKVEEGDLNYCTENFGDSIRWTDLDQQIAEGTFFDSTTTPMQAWAMEKNLYFKLLRFPELIVEDSVSESFFTTSVDPSSAAFAQAEFELWEALLIDSTLQAGLDDINQTRELLQYDLMELDEIDLPVDTFGIDSALYAEKMLLLDSLLILDTLWHHFRSLQSDERLSSLSGVDTLLGQLPADSTYESSEQFLLQMVGQAAKGVPFSNEDLEDMREIAEACPQAAGPVGREITRWLPLCESSQYLTDEELECLEERSLDSERPKSNLIWVELSVNPNPAKDRIEVFFETTDPGRLLVVNAIGAIIKVIPLEPGEVSCQIFTGDIPTGIYFLTLEQGGKITGRLSVSIQH